VARFTKWFGNLFSNAGAFAVGAATSDTLRPGLQDLVNETWSKHPTLPLDPRTAAEADRRGVMTTGAAQDEANRSGISDSRYATLLALTKQLPSGQVLAQAAVQGALTKDAAKALAALSGTDDATFETYYKVAGDPIAGEEALTLWNRGELSEADVDTALRQSRLKPEWVDRFKALRFQLPPISDTIRMAVRDVFSAEHRAELNLDAEYPEGLTAAAQKLGLSDAAARNYWAAHWDLPSYTQGAQMMFRGEITPAQFGDLLRALDYAPRWREPLANIARAIPSTADFIRFAVREVFDPAQRQRLKLDEDYPEAFTGKAALHGLSEEDARDYWAAHWQLPSATQGYHMLWRDEIDATGLDQLLKALDYSPTWRDKLAAIARPTLGRVDIRRAFTLGVIDRAGVEAAYRRLGYDGVNLEALVNIATAPAHSSASVKELTAEQHAAEYEGGFVTADEFRAELAKLGYPAAAAAEYVALGDARRVARARTAAVGRIRSSYVGHKIPRSEAAAALAKEITSADTRDLILTEWDNELAVNIRVLTQAQILKLYKKGIYERATALEQLTDQGLDEADANKLLDVTVA
jgi:DNA-binding Lrp family transcriptional regulator